MLTLVSKSDFVETKIRNFQNSGFYLFALRSFTCFRKRRKRNFPEMSDLEKLSDFEVSMRLLATL